MSNNGGHGGRVCAVDGAHMLSRDTELVMYPGSGIPDRVYPGRVHPVLGPYPVHEV